MNLSSQKSQQLKDGNKEPGKENLGMQSKRSTRSKKKFSRNTVFIGPWNWYNKSCQV